MRRPAALAVLAAVLIGAGAWLLLSEDADAPAPSEAASASPPPSAARVERRGGARGDTPDDESAALDLQRRLRLNEGDGGALDGAVDPLQQPGLIDDLARGQVQAWLRDNAEVASKRVDDYCKATRGLVGEKDSPPDRSRDAALYMLGRSDWEGGRLGLLHLTPVVTERMGNPPMAWRHLGPDLYAGLDFGWMKELLQFDSWSIATASPLADQAEQKNFFEAPLPNYVTLQYWVKLRLLKGLHENDLQSASLEVRHLAELCGTNGTLVSDMIRVAIYGIERGFFAFAAMDFLLPGVDPAVREKAMKCVPNRCSALIEGLATATALRGIAPGADEQVEWLKAQHPCDPALVELTMKARPMDSKALLEGIGDRSLENSMQRLLETFDGGR